MSNIIESVLNRGIKIGDFRKISGADGEQKITVRLESLDGQANIGLGETIEESLIDALSKMVVDLDKYLRRAEKTLEENRETMARTDEYVARME